MYLEATAPTMMPMTVENSRFAGIRRQFSSRGTPFTQGYRVFFSPTCSRLEKMPNSTMASTASMGVEISTCLPV
jgi:hypothetical protein